MFVFISQTSFFFFIFFLFFFLSPFSCLSRSHLSIASVFLPFNLPQFSSCSFFFLLVFGHFPFLLLLSFTYFHSLYLYIPTFLILYLNTELILRFRFLFPLRLLCNVPLSISSLPYPFHVHLVLNRLSSFVNSSSVCRAGRHACVPRFKYKWLPISKPLSSKSFGIFVILRHF